MGYWFACLSIYIIYMYVFLILCLLTCQLPSWIVAFTEICIRTDTHKRLCLISFRRCTCNYIYIYLSVILIIMTTTCNICFVFVNWRWNWCCPTCQYNSYLYFHTLPWLRWFWSFVEGLDSYNTPILRLKIIDIVWKPHMLSPEGTCWSPAEETSRAPLLRINELRAARPSVGIL